MTEEQVRQLLVDTGAILEGHFLLTSGLHSALYVEKFQVLQYPEHTAALCAALAEKFCNAQVELVVGPVTGGILLAHEVGKNLGTRAIFTERENGKMALRRGFKIQPGERVLVVEDIVTTGGSVKEVIEVVRMHGGIPVGVGILVDRSGSQAEFGIPAQALLHLSVEVYQPDVCPLCAQGTAITKRGSRNI
jgi:orotate phosphoribosyltransferase